MTWDLADTLDCLGTAQCVEWDKIRPSLLDAATEIRRLRKELAGFKTFYASPPPPAYGSCSVSSCGCSSWDDGRGNSGKYFCAKHCTADTSSGVE